MPIQIPDAGTDSASHFSLDHPQASTVNLKNPLPLSAAQEAQVKQLYYKRVRDLCGPEVAEFAKCAKGRTVTATWACRQERFKMNSCMMARAGPAEEDKAREEWFNGIQERRRKREEESIKVEERRAEVIELTRRKAEQEAREAEEKASASKEVPAAAKKGWFS